LESTEIAIRQAELVLKLYELRREPVMRQARSYIGGRVPTGFRGRDGGAGDLRQAEESLYSAGVRLLGYGGGVCTPRSTRSCSALRCLPGNVLSVREDQPYLGAFREKMNLPEWMRNIERVIGGSAEGRSRLEVMRRNVEETARLRAQPVAG
jgi:hypothetical protein